MAVERAVIPLVLMVLLYSSPGVQCFFERISCTISSDCNCDFKPNIRGLEWDLYKNLYGQHLAQDIVSEEVANFLQKESPDRPLVLSFHGGSGTGKTLVSSMLGRHLYGTAMGSPYIHQFVPTLHFPSPDRIQQYRLELKDWVQGNVTACARSIFIFDEMENMPPGVIDILKPFLGPSHTVFGTNYRKAIYIFISTIGEEVIHRMALETRQAGKEREEIRLVDLEDAISHAVFNNSRSKSLIDLSINSPIHLEYNRSKVLRSNSSEQPCLSPPRWILPFQHHPGEAVDQLCALPAPGQMPCGALCPQRALPAW
uniref:Torsin family 2 member A n=1 Tax=Hucho hucho TaxID=62062 RepID=A0A4W5QPK9_9TELE